VFDYPQLFEAFRAFERCRRKRCHPQEEVATVSVQPEMPPEWRLRVTRPGKGNRGPGKVEGAPSRVDMEVVVDGHPATPPAIQPLTVIFDRARIRELLAPYETDVARVRFLAVLDPARLRAPSALFWRTSVPCRPELGRVETWAYIDADDIARWLAPSGPAPSR